MRGKAPKQLHEIYALSVKKLIIQQMNKFVFIDKFKNLLIVFETLIILFLVIGGLTDSSKISPNQKVSIDNKREDVAIDDLIIFPALDFPEDYFVSKKNIGAGAYSTLHDDEGYRSYPSTQISLREGMYSLVLTDLPPIKTDKEIHTELPDADFMGSSKAESIKKYGEIARRYAGEGGNGTSIYDIQYADLDMDGVKEQIVAVSEMGANVIGQQNIIIKDGKEIFSTSETSFSVLRPAPNGNGFYLEWDDNFKKRDGYVVTRFISENGTFKPIYEQKIRYIRIK